MIDNDSNRRDNCGKCDSGDCATPDGWLNAHGNGYDFGLEVGDRFTRDVVSTAPCGSCGIIAVGTAGAVALASAYGGAFLYGADFADAMMGRLLSDMTRGIREALGVDVQFAFCRKSDEGKEKP